MAYSSGSSHRDAVDFENDSCDLMRACEMVIALFGYALGFAIFSYPQPAFQLRLVLSVISFFILWFEQHGMAYNRFPFDFVIARRHQALAPSRLVFG